MSDPLAPPPPPLPGGGYGYGEPPAGGLPARPGLPWERHKDPGSLIETTQRLILSPTAAFAEAREKGDYGSPLLFAVVFMIVGALLQTVWRLLLPSAGSFLDNMQGVEGIPPEVMEMLGGGAIGVGSIAVSILVAPIVGIIGLFIGSALVHLCLNLLGGLRDSSAGFEGTFRAVSYSQVAQLAYVVPFVGVFIAVVANLALAMIGLSSLHRTSQGKALASVLLPCVLCCCVVAGLMLAFGAAIMAMVGAGAN